MEKEKAKDGLKAQLKARSPRIMDVMLSGRDVMLVCLPYFSYQHMDVKVKNSWWLKFEDVVYRIALHYDGWEFWMLKRHLENLAKYFAGPIVKIMFTMRKGYAEHKQEWLNQHGWGDYGA